jgi:hypothetical protein
MRDWDIPAALYAMLICAVLGWSGDVQAQHHHPPQDGEIHDRLYSTWMRPDQPNVSCCHKLDCAPAQARMIGGRWFAKRDGDSGWLPVPPEKVETKRDSPDGRSHLCAPWGQIEAVFCFLPAGGV